MCAIWVTVVKLPAIVTDIYIYICIYIYAKAYNLPENISRRLAKDSFLPRTLMPRLRVVFDWGERLNTWQNKHAREKISRAPLTWRVLLVSRVRGYFSLPFSPAEIYLSFSLLSQTKNFLLYWRRNTSVEETNGSYFYKKFLLHIGCGDVVRGYVNNW